jgi:SAM-dependent methyltransferase
MDISPQGIDYISFYMSYKLKLIEFNSTGKYKKELAFLYSLLNVGIKDVVLDYGCGIGTSVELLRKQNINAFGYDVYRWVDGEPEWFSNSFSMKFSHIYFMHSFAHIPNPHVILENLKDSLQDDGIITVITPNKDWLDLMRNDNYKPDPTVVEHFTPETLNKIFVSNGYTVLFEGQFGNVKGNINERLFIKCRK